MRRVRKFILCSIFDAARGPGINPGIMQRKKSRKNLLKLVPQTSAGDIVPISLGSLSLSPLLSSHAHLLFFPRLNIVALFGANEPCIISVLSRHSSLFDLGIGRRNRSRQTRYSDTKRAASFAAHKSSGCALIDSLVSRPYGKSYSAPRGNPRQR
jgi:hypothetical protein